MKHLLPIALTVLLLACCTTPGEYRAMSHGLDSINGLNRSDRPFSPADVQPYVSYFDRHGSGNDRLLAHYLLGRAYHEQGEAPMALRCYQEALAAADTTAADCDYAQLSRVYGQMGGIFYKQGLYIQQLSYSNLAESYAWKGKDTLAALMNKESRGLAYRKLGMYDSTIIVAEEVSKQYQQFGYGKYSVIALSKAFRPMLYTKKNEKLKSYMLQYEMNSGLFDENGFIKSGKEIYYNIKGLAYFQSNSLDSAEYWFRKELNSGHDFNNQNAGAYGLAMVYESLNRTDSAAKYYRYAYAMNDSMYAQRTTEEVERMQSMYDYTRHQEMARVESEKAEKEKARWQMSLMILFSVFLIAFIIINSLNRKRKNERRIYQETLEDLDQAQTDILQLRLHESDYVKALADKEKKIDTLKKKMRKYSKLIYFGSDIIEKNLKSSPSYINIERKVLRGEVMTDEDWQKIRILVIEYLPGFNDFLLSNTYQLNETKYNICILLRLHFKSVDISKILGIRPASVSEACSSIMKKIFHEDGSAKELTLKLNEIF